MEKYDYRAVMCDDIRDYIDAHGVTVTPENREDLYNDLYDDLWISDDVTGNNSGYYVVSDWEAEENLCHNLELLADALAEFDGDASDCLNNATTADVTIRCYLLGECLNIVLDELADEWETEHGDDLDAEDSED